MLNARFVEEYINAVGMHGHQSPIVPIGSLSWPVRSLSLDDFLGYSVVPIAATGQLAESGDDVRYLAMPHVYKRTKHGCGDVLARRADLSANARKAGLTANGFAPKRDTPPSLWRSEIHRAKLEADEIRARLVAVYGLPGDHRERLAEPESLLSRHESSDSHSAQSAPADARPNEAFTNEDDFFYYMLGKVRAAFERTNIARHQRSIGANWWYSVCALPLQRGADLLLGLKWGADPKGHHAQTNPPSPAEIREVLGYRFIARTRPFLERYVGPIETFNYLNVCPFRAPKLELLTELDWTVAVQEFFMETLEYLSPRRTVIVGTSDVQVLLKHGLVDCERVQVVVGGKSESGYRGVIRGRRKHHAFGAVPQPTYAMTNEARNQLWAAVFR